jgi:hypothetical protein
MPHLLCGMTVAGLSCLIHVIRYHKTRGDKMTEENDLAEDSKKRAPKSKWHGHQHQGAWGGAYGLVFVGAVVYYIQQSDTFWMGVLGFFKAIVWPAMLTYRAFTLLGM